MHKNTKIDRLLTTLVLLLTLGACSSGSDGTPPIVSSPPAPTAQKAALLEATQQRHVITEIGTVAALDVNVLDGNGEAISVAQTWRSSAPTVVSVDSMGNVTALGIGSAAITVTIDAAETTLGVDLTERIDVTVVTLQPNVVMLKVSDLTAPTTVERALTDGNVVARLTLTTNAMPDATVGDAVLLYDLSVIGEVTEVISVADNTIIDVTTRGISTVVSDAMIDVTATLDDLVFPASFVVPVEQRADTLKANVRAPNERLGTVAAPSINTLLDNMFDGEFGITLGGGFKCSSSIEDAELTLTSNLNPDLNYRDISVNYTEGVTGGVFESAKITLDLDADITFDGYIDWTTELQGKVTCKLLLAAPFYQAGPVVISLPIGVEFSIDVTASSIDGRANVSGTMPYRVSLVAGYDTDGGVPYLDVPVDVVVDTDDLVVSYEIPDAGDPNTLRSQLKTTFAGFIAPRAGAGIGASIGIYKVLDHLKGGLEGTLDIATAERQASEPGFKSTLKLEAFGKRKPEDPLFMFAAPPLNAFLPVLFVIQTVVDFEALLTFERRLALSQTPSGVTQISEQDAFVGTPVDFSLTLADPTFRSLYQIERVVVYRVEGTGLSTSLSEYTRIAADSGQTQFDWRWTPEANDAGIVRFVPFVTSSIVPGAVFQADDIFEISVLDDAGPTTIDNLLSASVSVRGTMRLITPSSSDTVDINETENMENPFNADARASALNQDILVQATAAFGVLRVRIDVDTRYCGSLNIDASASLRQSVRNFRAGETFSVAGSYSGPRSFDLGGDDNSRSSVEIEVNAAGSLDDKLTGGGQSSDGYYEFYFNGDENGWSTDPDYNYRGGSAAWAIEPIITGQGSNVVSARFSNDAEVDVNFSCIDFDSDARNRLELTYTVGLSSL
ncbi:MAG: hypothetical protein AAF004_13545 [Pseudomonadota bacterium]